MSADQEHISVLQLSSNGLLLESRVRILPPPEDGDVDPDMDPNADPEHQAHIAHSLPTDDSEFGPLLPSRLLLRSPNGSLFALSVSDAGELFIESAEPAAEDEEASDEDAEDADLS